MCETAAKKAAVASGAAPSKGAVTPASIKAAAIGLGSAAACAASAAASTLKHQLAHPGVPMKQFTREAIAERVAAGEVIIIVQDKVYNLTKWVKHHPGGDLAVRHMAGRDATDAMIAFHPEWVFLERLPHFIIGELVADARVTSPISADFRRLESKLHEMGMFKTDYAFYAREIAKFVALWLAMIYFAVFGPKTLVAYLFSALCAATLWQQAAFVAHDTGHSGISHDRKIDTGFGIGLANFFGGLSIGWWKRNHNVHHIITNDPEHDPDIQHMPFLAITARLANNLYSTYYNRIMEFDAIAKVMIPIQHYTFYIILAFGRFNLYVNSWAYVFATKHDVPYRYHEIVGMTFFWVWYLWLLSNLPTAWHIVGYVLVSHMVTVFLHMQITLSHFGMPTASIKEQEVEESFAEMALRTTLDVDCPRWMDWFHGGLQFQVEHHIFPRLPRHNLRKVRPAIEAFAKDHGLEYHSLGFIDCNKHTLGVLEQVAHQVAAIIAVDPRKVHIH